MESKLQQRSSNKPDKALTETRLDYIFLKEPRKHPRVATNIAAWNTVESSLTPSCPISAISKSTCLERCGIAHTTYTRTYQHANVIEQLSAYTRPSLL